MSEVIKDISTVKERIWDYSTLSSFQTCRKKYYWEHVRNLRPAVKGVALEFGGAIHEALDAYYIAKGEMERKDGDGSTVETEDSLLKTPPASGGKEPLACAIDTFSAIYKDREGDELRTVANGIKILEWYSKKYASEPFKVEGKPESGFVFFIGDILYGGRIDLPVTWDGNLWIMEHKTTTRLTGSFFDQFEVDKQITGYIIAAEEFYKDQKVMGCIVNVMEPWKELIRPTAKSKTPEDHFLRKPITRSTFLKERFRLNVQRIVRDIKWCEANDEFMEAEKKEVCQYYNRPCPYLQLCQYGEDERTIKRDYIEEKWEPFKQTDAVVEAE